MIAAAMTGPTPKIWVSEVPDAATAAVSFAFDSRSRASRWRRSAAKSEATWCRARATAPAGAIPSRMTVAWPAVMRLDTPPGTSSHKAAWRRQAACVRRRPRSRCRRDQIRRTVSWSSAATGRVAGDRRAATATDRASLGSFLLVAPDCRSRTRAASLGWTSRTCSPAARSCWASRCPSPPAPSTAQSARARPLPRPPAGRPGWQRPARAACPAAPRTHRGQRPCARPCAGQCRSGLPPARLTPCL
jgi:hypothetical protein